MSTSSQEELWVLLVQCGDEETLEHVNMKPKNTTCLWFDKDAHEAARFDAATFEAARRG